MATTGKFSWVVFWSMVAMPSIAEAEEAAVQPAPVIAPSGTRAVSYGAKLAIADGAAIAGILVSGLTMDNCHDQGFCGWQESSLFLSLSSLAVTSPVLHLVHRNPMQAGLSLSLRVVVPALAFFVGASTCPDIGECSTGEFSALAGLATVLVVDWTLLARNRPRPSTAPVAVTPIMRRGGAGVVVSMGF